MTAHNPSGHSAYAMIKWLRIFAVCALAMTPAFAIGGSTAAQPAPTASELQVKAAILYRAAKFIEWPASAFAATDAPFVVCVVGNINVVRAFDSLTGRTLNGHGVVVRRVTGDILDLRQCHTAFFPAEAEADIDYALGKLKGLPVLTVGEAEDFAHRGGILALLTREERVKFALNLPVSKQAGLNVSSQLLQLATVVGRAP